MNYMQRRWWRREWRDSVLMAAVIGALIFLGGIIAPVHGESPAWDFEAGYQLTPTPGPYVSARVNLPLGELGPVGLWLLPEGGVVLGDPAEWYGRVQLLADTSIGTVGGEVRIGGGSGAPPLGRVFVRFGL